VSTARASSLSTIDRATWVRIGVVAGLLAVLVFLLPAVLSLYWIDVLTATAIYSVVALGLALLMGRVGLVSLGQIAILALGAWVAARIDFGTSLPFPIVLLLAGLVTMVLGTLVGLPALRLSGLYLALITNFPNGGTGFLGHTESASGSTAIRRPALAESDPAYFRYTVVVAALLFLLALWHIRSKPGRAWAAIRQSEPAALAAGVNITLYKLWAFALASFLTGVAGGLLGPSVGKLYTFQFPTRDSIILLAVVLMGGIYSLWGAVVAGIFMKFLPAVLDSLHLPADLLTILFGVGVLQVLLTAPAGLAAQMPKDLAKLWGLISGASRRGRPAEERAH
jgi:branched-chain amino acid transport system permease protein